jgi:glycosyltransferase involved in cell wall biosynthesis
MTRIVHLTTVHPRDDIRIFHKQCVSLAAAGYEVFQVVGDGLGDADCQGVNIVDIGPRPAGRWARMRQQPGAALAAVQRLAPALLHIHDPELLPLAVRVARSGTPVVYDAHEDVPRQILTKQWLPAWARPGLAALFEHYENHQVAKLAAVSAATPHIAARFAKVHACVRAICNYPFLHELAPAEDIPQPPRERAVCYVGGLMRTRGLLPMLRALPLVPGVRLLLCGRFEDAALETEARAEPGWAQVDYLGQVGRDAVRAVMARASAGLVTLLPMPSYLDSLPIKMFEYMSAGLPVIASDFPLWRGIVGEAGCGLCVDPASPVAIAEAIRQVLDHPSQAQAWGEAGRRAVHQHYHWPRAEAELRTLYAQLLGPAAR